MSWSLKRVDEGAKNGTGEEVIDMYIEGEMERLMWHRRTPQLPNEHLCLSIVSKLLSVQPVNKYYIRIDFWLLPNRV